MSHWYRINRIGAAGVLASLLFGVIELIVFLADGVARADLNTPMGMLANQIASHYTLPPTPFRAGSERRALTYQLVVSAHVLVVLGFALLLWLRTRMRQAGALGHALMAAQIVLAVGTMSALQYVLAAELALVLPARKGLQWLAAQILLLGAVTAYLSMFHDLGLRDDFIALIWVYGSMSVLFQPLAFGAAWLAVRDVRTRIALAATNAHLLATQSMLADTVRAGERLRIARDLHDAVGHHLTALNLHLDLALRQASAASGPALPASLHTSRELASSLLSEVRAVVSAERNEHIDLRTALSTLCRGIPSPRVTVAFEDRLEIASPVLAHTLFFCVQEGLTNSVRHAGAARVRVVLRRLGDSVQLRIDDDGAGLRGAPEGNGLRGMRERVEEQGGSLRIDGARGCALHIALPLAWSPA
ncbi:MAG TPA: histidine kinase [Telluria sp.]|jgi:signal transduction histidine kinase